MTEAEIRREHPEATPIDGSRVLVDLPDTEAEIPASQQPARRQRHQ